MKYTYSQEIADEVEEFLSEDDWRFSFNEDTGIFEFDLALKSPIQMIHYRVFVQDEEVAFYGICPVGVDCNNPKMMAEMAEFICRANYGLENGCFELSATTAKSDTRVLSIVRKNCPTKQQSTTAFTVLP